MHDNRDLDLRAGAVAALRRLDALGLNRGSSGNLSLRGSAPGMWITPTGMEPGEIGPEDMVWLGDRDDSGSAQGRWEPSSEWPFHRAIYRVRADLRAVVHTHSVHATALACLRRGLPAFHYMVALAGGDSVPCTPYHLFGSEDLSSAVGASFVDRDACLMANHGLVAGGTTLGHALKLSIEVEALCEAYLKALAVGEPVLLSPADMGAAIERFKTYGTARRVP